MHAMYAISKNIAKNENFKSTLERINDDFQQIRGNLKSIHNFVNITLLQNFHTICIPSIHNLCTRDIILWDK